jgi:hypothetical protein
MVKHLKSIKEIAGHSAHYMEPTICKVGGSDRGGGGWAVKNVGCKKPAVIKIPQSYTILSGTMAKCPALQLTSL